MKNASNTSPSWDERMADAAQQRADLRMLMNSMVKAGRGENAVTMLLDVIQGLQQDNIWLTAVANAARRARFGRSSEKLSKEELVQLALAFGASEEEAQADNPTVPVPAEPTEDAETESAPKRRKKNTHRGRKPLPPHLPRHVNLIPVPDCDKNCLHCGRAMEVIDHVDHERVEFIPARIEVYVDRREKVACLHCKQDITTAARREAPAARVDNNEGRTVPVDVQWRAGLSIMAHLIESKCDDAMPVNRVRDQFAKLGFDVPLNTLYGYWKAGVQLIQPIAQIILSSVLGDDIVGVDDTRLDWLDPTQKSKRQRGHLWCFVGTSQLVAFEFTKTWEAREIAPWLDAIDGFIQCDDYAGYSSTLDDGIGGKRILVPPDRRLGCWMHVRHRFHDALKAGEKQAGVGLKFIHDLYKVEDKAKKEGLAHDDRGALRATLSQPIADDFYNWVHERQKLILPRSYLGKAIGYAIGQKEFAMRCLSNGRFEIDNGRVERAIRGPVVGRKNYLFSGSAEAATLLAGTYSVIRSCRNLGIRPYTYLVDVMTKLRAGYPLRDINQLRPDVWVASRLNLVEQQMAKQTLEHAN